jgi:hypothetical protein
MHILDFIMYWVIVLPLAWLLDKIFDDYIGSLVAFIVLLIYTVTYIHLFVLSYYNWSDIFRGTQPLPFNITW